MQQIGQKWLQATDADNEAVFVLCGFVVLVLCSVLVGLQIVVVGTNKGVS